MQNQNNTYWVRHQYLTKDNRLVLAIVKMVNGKPTEERIAKISTPLKIK